MGTIRYRQRAYTASLGAPYRGIETLIKYNGLILGDRRFVDIYDVNEVTGMDDADIRDSREDNPEADGENAYNSFYSGRTITIKGDIRGGNVSTVREMQSDLKLAFNSLEEGPLDFIFNDVDEDFNDNNAALDFYTGASVAAGTNLNPTGWTISSGKLFATNVNANPISLKIFSDFYGLIHFRTGATVPSGSNVSINGRWTGNSPGQYLETQFIFTGSAHQIRVRNNAVTLSSVSATLYPDTEYWFKSGVNGDHYFAQVFTDNPEVTERIAPYASVSGVLTGANATALGGSVRGKINWNYLTGTTPAPQGNGWYVDDVSLRNGDTPDGRLIARKIGKIDMPDAQTGRFPTRPFMITMRASDPQIVSRTEAFATGDASSNVLTFPGGGTGIPLPAIFTTATLTVVNRGNYFSYPFVRFYGGLSNPALLNVETGEKISIVTTINDGDYIDVDVKNRTIIDSNGNNVYGYLATDHSWMRLSAGTSTLSLGNDSFSGADPRVEIYWRHSWV